MIFIHIHKYDFIFIYFIVENVEGRADQQILLSRLTIGKYSVSHKYIVCYNALYAEQSLYWNHIL